MRRRRNQRPYGKIILICVITLVVTLGMGRYFESLVHRFGNYDDTQPVINDSNNGSGNKPEDQQEHSMVANSEGYQVFVIQNGVFSVEGGAQAHAATLEVDGFNSAIFYDDNYRVVTGIYLDKDKALEELENQRDLGYENFIMEVEIPAVSINVSSEEEKYSVEGLFTKFNKVISNSLYFFQPSTIKEPLESSNLNYQGDEHELLKINEIVNSYFKWEASQDEAQGNDFVAALCKYLRNIE